MEAVRPCSRGCGHPPGKRGWWLGSRQCYGNGESRWLLLLEFLELTIRLNMESRQRGMKDALIGRTGRTGFTGKCVGYFEVHMFVDRDPSLLFFISPLPPLLRKLPCTLRNPPGQDYILEQGFQIWLI